MAPAYACNGAQHLDADEHGADEREGDGRGFRPSVMASTRIAGGDGEDGGQHAPQDEQHPPGDGEGAVGAGEGGEERPFVPGPESVRRFSSRDVFACTARAKISPERESVQHVSPCSAARTSSGVRRAAPTVSRSMSTPVGEMANVNGSAAARAAASAAGSGSEGDAVVSEQAMGRGRH